MSRDFNEALEFINSTGFSGSKDPKQTSDAYALILYNEAETFTFFNDNGEVEPDDHLDWGPYRNSGSYGFHSKEKSERGFNHIFLRNKDGEAFFLNMDENGVLTGCTPQGVTQPSEFMSTYGPAGLREFGTQQKPGFFANLFHSLRNSWLITALLGKPKEPDEVDRYNELQQRGNDFLKKVGYTKPEAPAQNEQSANVQEQKHVEEAEAEKETEPWFPGQDLDESAVYEEPDPNSTSAKLDAIFNNITVMGEQLGREEFVPNGKNLYKSFALLVLRSKIQQESKRVENGEPVQDRVVNWYLKAFGDISANQTEKFREQFSKRLDEDAERHFMNDPLFEKVFGEFTPDQQQEMQNCWDEDSKGIQLMRECAKKYNKAAAEQIEAEKKQNYKPGKKPEISQNVSKVEMSNNGPS